MKEGESEESSSASEIESEAELEPEVKMNPRPYQVELLERAKERNTIVCLGTGTGKTFISVMLIKEMAHQIRETFQNGGKRTFFLVNTVPLASQQAKVIGKHTDLKVQHYVGEMGVDFWDKYKWQKQFNENNVLVMTAQIFLNLLSHTFIKLSQVNLLIFDECHHAKKKHPYRQIMQFFMGCETEDCPKVLGLTAAVVHRKVKAQNIESEIKELECTLRSTCETSQDEEIEKFAAKPKEEVVTFSNNRIDNDLDILVKRLQEVLRPGIDLLPELKDCEEALLELGPWAANRLAECLVKGLERSVLFQLSREEQQLCDILTTQLRKLQSVYHTSTSLDVPEGCEQCCVMPKLKKLLSVLKNYGNSIYNECEKESKLCGIVFVEKRWTAVILSEQINFAALQDRELAFVKSKFVIGHGMGTQRVGYSKETEMDWKKQEEVLRQFRRHEFNLLIATSVVEEGLDIPKCNVVCRFDFPDNVCSYLQSKGRARAKDSIYYIFVDEREKEEKDSELETMQAIERSLLERCHNRKEPTEEECDQAAEADQLLPPYQTKNGARVTMSSSLDLLSWYCSKLPGDRFTHLNPVYNYKSHSDGYICELEMPTNCQLRKTIVSPPMRGKNLAKMTAAFFACQELHRIGELDDNLLPVRSLSDEESEPEEEETETGGRKRTKAGTRKRKRIYERKVPKLFIGSLVQDTHQPHYLTVISIRITKLTHPKDLEASARFFRDDACHKFGLLTNVPLPAVRPFKLYPDYGEVTVSLSSHSSPLRAKDLEIVQHFHLFLFRHILQTPVEFKARHTDGEADGYFVVLVKDTGYDVDYDSMKDALHFETAPNKEDVVVTKNYMYSQQRRQRFAVLKVRPDLSPLSPFPDKSKAKTYESYFRQCYGKHITNKGQPLIEVKDISDRVNFLVDRKVSSKSKRDVIHLVPELCDVLPIRGSLLSVSLMLPSILHRVNTLLLVGDVKSMIAGVPDDTNEFNLPAIGAESVNDEKSLLHVDSSSAAAGTAMDDDDEDYDDDDDEFPGLFLDLKSLFRSRRGPVDHPDTAFVLQALTTTHSGDAFNLERLEMLGDAFLKLAVSLHLFMSHQDKDEGKLTQRKKKQISNLALYRAAAKKTLAGYQQCTPLARDTWCPTGCQFTKLPQESITGSGDAAIDVDSDTFGAIEEEMDVEYADGAGPQDCDLRAAKGNIQVISDKSVADSMEALIGAYLISCGYLGALRFMRFLGLKVLPEVDGNDDLNEFAEKSKAGCYTRFWTRGSTMTGASDSEDMVSRMVSGLKNFEKNSIHYTFRSKLYLLEALTHASYHTNRVTPCYQRLEFLGDALLDFLVTQHLYFRHAKLSPGELTDIRQALVNNNIFAAIAVKHDYNKYLKQMSLQWFKTIENFITRVEHKAEEREKNHQSKVTADAFIIVSEQDDEGIEAPKVLGDIFESVAGAVFLDSGMDLTKIWGVYYRMMKPYIDPYSVHIPINPIRRVYEEDDKRNFSKAKTLPDGRTECTLQVHWGTFVGKGANYRIAKATAGKLAMEALERRDAHETGAVGGIRTGEFQPDAQGVTKKIRP
ncbi:endoribonuclease Dicer-like [Montipora capricornis]|uniref:endoribonuclease Dicer-like n=1 Tax=Montipora capricornis TaxID=246305 RepID=UPI0035F1FC82